jgi:hypothetical protein
MLDLKLDSPGATTSASMPAISSILRRHSVERSPGENDSLLSCMAVLLSHLVKSNRIARCALTSALRFRWRFTRLTDTRVATRWR